MNTKLKTKLVLVSCIAFLLAGCASIRKPTDPQDPYQALNEKTFHFNEQLDKAIFKPVAQGYAKIVPAPARNSIGNFFQNVEQPSVIINDALQGDFMHAMADSWRFFINSTFGLFGLFDVASKMNVPIPQHVNNFGLTLTDWGLNDPKYFVIPFLGPSTDVDVFGRFVNYYAMEPYVYIHPYYDRWAILGTYYLNKRSLLLQYNSLISAAALNPYVFVRNLYMQRRKTEVEQMHRFIDSEYASLEDTQPGYFIKPTHPWNKKLHKKLEKKTVAPKMSKK